MPAVRQKYGVRVKFLLRRIVKRHGLRSTSSLLDLFEISGKERAVIETLMRRDSVTITHPVHGQAVIRDQKPIPRNGNDD